MSISPSMKQCLVTFGAAINQAIICMIPSYTSRLLPQLRRDDSIIAVDDNMASWIASVHGITLFVGNISVPLIMGQYGRKPANLVSNIISLIGWLCIMFSSNVTLILIGNLLQGLSMGMVISLPSIVIAECTNPKNRAIFTSVTLIQLSITSLLVHTIGSYCSWKLTAFVCAIIIFTGLLITIITPESPSWLAEKGKYEESKQAFLWLRGEDGVDEFEHLMNAATRRNNDNKNASKHFLTNAKRKILKNMQALKYRECFMPVLIMIHLYTFGNWCGASTIIIYLQDIFSILTSPDTDINLQIVFTDVLCLCYNIIAIFILKNCKRRFILCSFLSFNILILLCTALYTYCKAHDILPFDYPFIGILLVHLFLFSYLSGILPLTVAIDGEVFCLEYRSFSAGITNLYYSIAISLVIKTFSYLKNCIGFHGTYLLYTGICSYTLLFLLKFMPETKDKTLLDIENEFKKEVVTPNDSNLIKPLTVHDHIAY
ncbi:facilitated trehalose transporter Tret1-2 homolog [Achroia grisella]|uniref:facilitated trehalose transporter Tret1-2 homolog n=1 Tax=Achroia grisella TaxID=688607 RepID=UPI0027D2E554|nr:facilitated trehalose transporter Tret1-2 homolog [Achroia grisella]